MAVRRIKTISIDEDTQPVKTGFLNGFLWNKDTDDWQGLPRYYRKAPRYQAKVSTKFDTTDFDGIHMMAALWKNDQDIIHGGNCTFNVYKIDLSNNWAETLLYTTAGSLLGNGSFGASASQANLGALNELDGELTLAIEVQIQRFNRTYCTPTI